MEYTTLSLAQVQAGLDAIPADMRATFGGLDARQLNWRPDDTKWSVAQPRTIWQRLPGLPGLFGRMLIRSQAPQATRKYTASPLAQPGASDIPPDVVDRFLVQNREILSWLRGFDDSRAAHAIMTSPFVRFITYSVLDGARLVLAHDHRHLEQARRVTHARISTMTLDA